MFVEQPSYDYLDICEDKGLNKISASINTHRIILPRIKIVLRDSSLYSKQLCLSCLLWLISANFAKTLVWKA